MNNSIEQHKFSPVDSTAWETLVFLLAWTTFNDTIPALVILLAMCLINGILLGDRSYVRKFFLMTTISYMFYFAHVWLLRYEYRIFDTDLPLYNFMISYFIVWELHILFKFADKVYGLRIPFVTNLFEKWEATIDKQSTPRKDRKI